MAKTEKVSKNNMQKVFKITKSLKCQLTSDELLAAGLSLAEALEREEALENEKKAVTDQFKAQITEVTAQVTVKRNLVQNKYEYRPTDCEEIHDFTKSVVNIYRLDTGELINQRAMTQDEKQGKLDFDKAEADKKKA